LSNYTESRVHDLIVSAFAMPLEAATEMIRFTFVVGGGKLIRAKYDEDLPKWMVTALREIGFNEDRSAALDFSSQGTFKHQHDTGQNIKTIIVFPHVLCCQKKAPGAATSGSAAAASAPAANSPETIVRAAGLDTFKEIVASKTSTWKQKKNLLKVLQDGLDDYRALEAKLVRGEALSPAEQARYDESTGEDEVKITWLQGEIKAAVDSGKLTAKEKAEVLGHIDSNIAAVTTELDKARAENKPKKVATLEDKLKALVERKASVQRVEAVPFHRLKHCDEIMKHRLKLLALQPLEEKQRAQSLTMAELKMLEPKPDIEEAIRGLEQASKGWFADEEIFRSSCENEERLAREKYAASKRDASKKKTGSSASSTGTAGRASGGARAAPSALDWSTVGVKRAVKPSAAKSAPRGGSGFAAAFDDDSDDSA
jgi:hypothetical protein